MNNILMIAGQIMFAIWIFSGFNFRKMGRIILAGVIGLTLVILGIFNKAYFGKIKELPQIVRG